MAAEEIMAAKENSVKRYVVRLSADESEQLEEENKVVELGSCVRSFSTFYSNRYFRSRFDC
jgi:hypothetical protein